MFTTATPGFTGTITSANLGTTLDSNLSGVDASDLVTFSTLWENVGRGPGGAVGLTVKDTCPAGFDCASVTNFSVSNGAGTPLTHTGTAADFLGGAGLVLTDPVPPAPAPPEPLHDATGNNLVVISYTLPVSVSTIPAQVATNTATTVYYSNTASNDAFGNPPVNFVPGDRQPDTDTAAATTANYTFTKALASSSAAHTTSTNLTIGEVATYRLTITVPEGRMPITRIVDVLANSTNRMSITGVTSVTCSGGITSTNILCGNPGGVVISGTTNGTLTADFGTITNTNDNPAAETIVIEYTAVVNNQAANTQGATNRNTATLRTTNALGATVSSTPPPVTTTVQVPALTLTKTATPNLADAGDLITFTLQVTNAAGNANRNAYDVVLTDPLPGNLINPSTPVLTSPPGYTCPAAASSGWVGNNLTVTWAELDRRERGRSAGLPGDLHRHPGDHSDPGEHRPDQHRRPSPGRPCPGPTPGSGPGPTGPPAPRTTWPPPRRPPSPRTAR